MIPLKKEFNKNEMRYKILERSKYFYFAEVRSMESGNIIGYESGRIEFRKARNLGGKQIESREVIIPNSKFGLNPADEFHSPRNKDKCYKNYLKHSNKS